MIQKVWKTKKPHAIHVARVLHKVSENSHVNEETGTYQKAFLDAQSWECFSDLLLFKKGMNHLDLYKDCG